ncbi:hypothetical protein HDU99_002791 [Rhizoclosmatium hyalinum]|nr:hypothetical protein HDU99_002791 [Rhizoclosmatium hyalinum]
MATPIYYQAAQRYFGASCTSPLALITYQFQTTCTGTNVTAPQPCLVSAPFATQSICVTDYQKNGATTFGSFAYAEVVIHSTPDCSSKTNIVGVRQYALNSIFQWGVNDKNQVIAGVNLYRPERKELLLGRCKDTTCGTVFSDVSDTFPADGRTCYRPADLFNPGTYVVTTIYNPGSAKPAAVSSPSFAKSSSGSGLAPFAVSVVSLLLALTI